jgi:hypothetical protein
MSSVCKAAMAAHDRALCHRAKIVIVLLTTGLVELVLLKMRGFLAVP